MSNTKDRRNTKRTKVIKKDQRLENMDGLLSRFYEQNINIQLKNGSFLIGKIIENDKWFNIKFIEDKSDKPMIIKGQAIDKMYYKD